MSHEATVGGNVTSSNKTDYADHNLPDATTWVLIAPVEPTRMDISIEITSDDGGSIKVKETQDATPPTDLQQGQEIIHPDTGHARSLATHKGAYYATCKTGFSDIDVLVIQKLERDTA